jgi:biopolymer transport protein ExbB/TolQ
VDKDRVEFGKWFVWVFLLMVCAAIVTFGLQAFGFWGGTVVQRKVFEESFQYSEARRREIATYEAQLAGMRARLKTQDLDVDTEQEIKAQIANVEMRLAVAKEMKED